MLQGAVSHPEIEQVWLSRIFPEWHVHREEAFQLINDFEFAMSARRVLEVQPLSRLEPATQSWMGKLLHEYWLWKLEVRHLTLTARSAAEDTDACYQRLHDYLDDRNRLPPLAEHSVRLPLWLEFHSHCQVLTDCISRFPVEVKVP